MMEGPKEIVTHEQAIAAVPGDAKFAQYVGWEKPFIILGTREDGRRWIASSHTSEKAAKRALREWENQK